MKKVLVLFTCCAILSACGGNSDSSSNGDSTSATDMAASSRQPEVDTNANDIGTNRSAGSPPSGVYEKGAQLISKSDCLTCHREDEKLVGPAYKEVASKYEMSEANVKHLAGKIIKGGSGVWGEVPMTPHPTISEEDAAEMAKYVLSLKE